MSIRNWSGTSTARLGTKRAASIASTSSAPHTTSGRVPSRAPAAVTRNRPTPVTTQTRSISSARRSRARPTAATTAATSALSPTTVGRRSGSGAHTVANAAAAPNAGAATARGAARRPERQDADDGRAREDEDRRVVRRARRPGREPAGQRGGRDGDRAPDQRRTAPAGPRGGGVRRRGPVAGAARARTPAATSTAPLATSRSVRARCGPRLASVVRRAAPGTKVSRHCAAYSRATSSAEAPAGTTRSTTPPRPWTVTRACHRGDAAPTDATVPPEMWRLSGDDDSPRRGNSLPCPRSSRLGRQEDSDSTRTVSATRRPTLRGGRLDEPELPVGRLELQPPPADRAVRGRDRRADERHPDARQPRLHRPGRHDGGRQHRRSSVHRGRACSCSRRSASSSSSWTDSGSSACSR